MINGEPACGRQAASVTAKKIKLKQMKLINIL
jgi:hypothetical protein